MKYNCFQVSFYKIVIITCFKCTNLKLKATLRHVGNFLLTTKPNKQTTQKLNSYHIYVSTVRRQNMLNYFVFLFCHNLSTVVGN
jgi:hypothetical protein